MKRFLFLKATQGNLFSTVVPVKGGTRKDGTVVQPHYALRRKKIEVLQRVRRKEPQSDPLDLFSAPAARQDKAPVKASVYELPFDDKAVPAFGVEPGTTKGERKRLNESAREVLVKHVKGAAYTDDEKSVLSRYSGRGGVGDSLNEFYTRPDVSAAMWKALNTLGISSGNVLEPSCGTGVFLTTRPKGVSVTGVELDATSAQIAAILHPDCEVSNGPAEEFATSDGREFDAVIGNVPFGLRGALIRDDKSDLKSAEQYFLDMAIDKTRTGGIVALIVPTGIMDGKSTRKFRERVLRKAEFLGALRMPNTAFESSHTEVTTDVVIFRKRNRDAAGALGVIPRDMLKTLGVWDEDFLSGSYYQHSPGNVLGRQEGGWRSKAGMGDDITVEGSMEGVADRIARFHGLSHTETPTVHEILSAAGDDEKLKARIKSAAVKSPYELAAIGDTKVVDGVTYVLRGRPPRWHVLDEPQVVVPEVEAAINLGDDLETFLADSDEGREQTRAVITGKLDAYISEYGNPARDKVVRESAQQHKSIWRLLGAMHSDGAYSDSITGEQATGMDRSDFGLVSARLALDSGGFTADAVAGEWTGGDREQVLDHLFASGQYAVEADGQHWSTMDIYLSGELWPKLDAAKDALAHEGLTESYRDQYTTQVSALEEAIDAVSLEDVEVTMNSGWVPPEVLEDFLNSTIAEYERANPNSSWHPAPYAVTVDGPIRTVSGGRYNSNIINKYINRTGLRKDDRPQIDDLNDQFKRWLCASDYRESLEETYNRKYRGFLQREYSDAPMDIPGLNPELDVHAYQFAGLRWALDRGKGIIAADVGLGKTIRALMLVKMSEIYGTAKKPLIVVPKSVLANWRAEAENWFPGSRVMVIGETYTENAKGETVSKADTAEERNRKYHELAQNNYDFVLMSQPAWNDLDLDPVTKKELDDKDYWVQRGEILGKVGDKRRKKIKEGWVQARAERDFEHRTDAIYLNDLGVDMVILDEGADFKNLYAAHSRFGEQPKFLGGSGLSNRALDTKLKTDWLRGQNGGKNVFMLTATPTKNSPLEIYSMLSHIAPEEWEDRGIRNGEDFIDRYCEFEEQHYLDTSGKLDFGMITAGFKNMDEVRELMRKYIDRKTAEDVGLKMPARDNREHLVDMTPEQTRVYEGLRILAAENTGADATGDSHIFSIMDKMGKASIDLDLLEDAPHGTPSPKIDACADEAAKLIPEGGQVIFADHVGVHEKIVEALVERGVPRSQIAIINGRAAKSSAQRQAISDKFNTGKLKVVVGNTATMGEGMNLQRHTSDVHHLELPWDPASMQQRNGRGLRQGNLNDAVRIHTYLAKGSFDGYRYQTIAAKKDWQDMLWKGGNRVQNLAREGAFSRDEMLIMLSSDPEAARKRYETDKSAASKRAEQDGVRNAAKMFSEFQSAKRNLSKLANKASTSAIRLQIKVQGMQAKLASDKYLRDKSVLDMSEPAMIQPSTGKAWKADMSFVLPGGKSGPLYYSNDPTKMVVTSVNTVKGDVMVRPHGNLSFTPISIPLSNLHDEYKFLKYDRDEEHSSALDSRSGIDGLKAARALSKDALEKNYSKVQAALKSSIREFKMRYDGPMGMRDSRGNVVILPHYNVRLALDDHDLLLPTESDEKAALESYVQLEATKTFATDWSGGKRNRSGYRTAEVHAIKESFTGWTSNGDTLSGVKNPWGVFGAEAYGDDFVSKGNDMLRARQIKAANRAHSFGESLLELQPLFQVYASRLKVKKDVLIAIIRSAKSHGVLDNSLSEFVLKNREHLSSGFFNMALPKPDTLKEWIIRVARNNDIPTSVIMDSIAPEGAP